MQIKSGQCPVYMLFEENKAYIVPRYQRSYAWDGEEVQDFLDDLSRCVEIRISGKNNKAHFLGGILMVSYEEAGSPVIERQVIDGQQRLATLSLLGKVLIESFATLADEVDDDETVENIQKQIEGLEGSFIEFRKMINLKEKTIQRLVLSRADKEFFRKFMHDEACEPERDSHELIKAAHMRIATHFSGKLSEAASVDEKTQYLLAVLDVISIDWTVLELITESRQEAYMLFQVLNDRGKGLTEGELLRAATLELLEQQPDDTKQESIAIAWDSMLSRQPALIEKYLRWVYTSHKGVRPGNSSLFDDFIMYFFPMYEVFQEQQKQLSLNEAVQVVDTVELLKKEFDALERLSDGEWPYEDDTAVTKWDKDRLNLLTKELEHDYCLPLLLAGKELDSKRFTKIVSSVERFYFRYKLIVNAHTTRMANAYNKAAVEIRKDPASYNPEILISELAIISTEHASSEKFTTSLRELAYKPNGPNKVTRYFLMTLEHYLRWYQEGANGEPMCLNKEIIFDFSNTSIEHIYPQNPKDDDQSDDLDKVLHDLGNLTFFGYSDNELAGNESFPDKKKVFEKSKIGMNSLVADVEEWTVDEVEKRTEFLVEVADQVFVP